MSQSFNEIMYDINGIVFIVIAFLCFKFLENNALTHTPDTKALLSLIEHSVFTLL